MQITPPTTVKHLPEDMNSGHTSPTSSSSSDEELDFDTVSDACACIGHYVVAMMQHLNYLSPEDKSTFDASCEPMIGIVPYFERICRYSKLTPESACCALVLVKRICSNPENCMSLTNYNAHRLLLTSSMVFAKYYDDDTDSNARWAKIAGLQLSELNVLEVDMLNCCNFDLVVSRPEFEECVRGLLQYRGADPPMQPPVPATTQRASSARFSHRSPSSHRSPPLHHHRGRHRHTLNGLSPTSSRASSPTHIDSRSRDGTPGRGSPHDVASPKSQRRTVSGAFISFFHNHPRHHSNNGSRDEGVGSSEDVVITSTPVSPSTSPPHGFHLRIPRTTSLQSLSQILHVSPRFSKTKGKKGAGLRRSSTKDEPNSMLAFVAQPQQQCASRVCPPPAPAALDVIDEMPPSCIATGQSHEPVSNVLAH